MLRLGGDEQGEQVVSAHTEVGEIRRSEIPGSAELVWAAASEDAEVARTALKSPNR